jgi:hypothetical protein
MTVRKMEILENSEIYKLRPVACWAEVSEYCRVIKRNFLYAMVIGEATNFGSPIRSCYSYGIRGRRGVEGGGELGASLGISGKVLGLPERSKGSTNFTAEEGFGGEHLQA